MGSLIIQEVVKDLLSKGLDNAKVLLLAGSRYALRIWGKNLQFLIHFFLKSLHVMCLWRVARAALASFSMWTVWQSCCRAWDTPGYRCEACLILAGSWTTSSTTAQTA